jgi:2-polyprenyl-3-methyl-5-hydroxy-6-metoxy-1,4-benzoquinol methylase
MSSPPAYGQTSNEGLVRLMSPRGRVLDVGCGEGAWAPLLRARGAQWLVGVEPAPASCTVAETRYDRALAAPVEAVDLSDLGGERFDVIIAADVLEHLVDPWSQMSRWRGWIQPGGELVVSVPNLRDARLVWRLAVHGEFTYADSGGLMDRTHLRWFTSSSLRADLDAAGWRPVREGGAFGPLRRRLDRLTAGRMRGYLAHQLHVIAAPA